MKDNCLIAGGVSATWHDSADGDTVQYGSQQHLTAF